MKRQLLESNAHGQAIGSAIDFALIRFRSNHLPSTVPGEPEYHFIYGGGDDCETGLRYTIRRL
jgi:hypothetical protein